MKHADSLKHRMEAFFTANPDEWLTVEDCVLKWGRNRKQINDAVSFIKHAGGIVRTEHGIVKTIWTQGAQEKTPTPRSG